MTDRDGGRARCIEIGTEAFYDDTSYAETSKVCGGCLIKDACLEQALLNEEQYGVWGGTTPRQRARMLKIRHGVTRYYWPQMRNCSNGHLLTDDNVAFDHRGAQRCRQCMRDYERIA